MEINGKARGGRSVLRNAERTAQANCGAVGFAGGEGGTGHGDADDEQRGGSDLDHQSNGVPLLVVRKRIAIISPKSTANPLKAGPVLA